MKVPGILNTLMCILDVIFNFYSNFFHQGEVKAAGIILNVPGAGLGVAGAALGTALSQLVIAVLMMYFLCFKSNIFKIKQGESWKLKKDCILRAVKLALPIGWENLMMCGAMVVSTRIVAPLGSVPIAANSFAVTAESLCYMPGYGIAEAAATLSGQSIGAGRKELARRFARLSVWSGIASMSVTGAAMFFAAPFYDVTSYTRPGDTGTWCFNIKDRSICRTNVWRFDCSLWGIPWGRGYTCS